MIMSSVTNKTFENDWANCAPGEINQMVQRMKTRRFLSMVRRDATVLTGLMVALFSGYFYFGVLPETQIDLGGIYCYQVQPLAEQLLTGQLDAETRQKVQRHIRYCEHCRQHVDNVRMEALHHGREGERNNDWDKVRNPEIVAQRDGIQPFAPLATTKFVD